MTNLLQVNDLAVVRAELYNVMSEFLRRKMEKTTDLVAVNELTAVRRRTVSELQAKCRTSISKETNLTTVPTHDEHLLGLIETAHKVTGYEINNLIQQIQSKLSYNAEQRTSLWQSLIGVYMAIDALDKDYFSKIETSFDLINQNYQKIKENTEDIRKSQEEFEDHRIQIDEQIAEHNGTLEALLEFTSGIDKLQLFEEIGKLDEIDDLLRKNKESLNRNEKNITTLIKNYGELTENLKKLKVGIIFAIILSIIAILVGILC